MEYTYYQMQDRNVSHAIDFSKSLIGDDFSSIPPFPPPPPPPPRVLLLRLFPFYKLFKIGNQDKPSIQSVINNEIFH